MASLLVIEHDPEGGCSACPLHWRGGGSESPLTVYCEAGADDAAEVYDPAPENCPLRAGSVVVTHRTRIHASE